ncbi:molybdopterin-dependent oxidoreductase [Actinocatenispora rupis]|uniref:Molybdopterin-binding protein n=1 Tax=Actinocatenispora rupis TaxID=519421 RepID=A0A8J3J671_9ACTN|nr:molybdopterin-binding protein [Actinocatenispora rupis]
MVRGGRAALSIVDDAAASPVRTERVAATLGIALGVGFGICFGTGILSHLVQHPPGWFGWPSRPVQLYRVTQGLHVATGIALVPLLLAKLWTVYPKLFERPPVRDLGHLLSRLSVTVLVASALTEVVSGGLNIARWYAPMPFFFTVAHHWTAWVAAGALLVHSGLKAPVVARALRRPVPSGGRRAFLATVGAAIGVVTLTTVGQTVRPLSRLDVLAPRRPGIGPQGLPVNKSATEAGVSRAGAEYRLRVVGPRSRELSLADLTALPHHSAVLPIACVEGWSASARWTGVRVRDLMALVGAPPGSRLRVESVQRGGLYRASTLPAAACRDPLSLLAMRLDGAELDLDHGYPCRLIAPNLPGVMQTKWVTRLEVLP